MSCSWNSFLCLGFNRLSQNPQCGTITLIFSVCHVCDKQKGTQGQTLNLEGNIWFLLSFQVGRNNIATDVPPERWAQALCVAWLLTLGTGMIQDLGFAPESSHSQTSDSWSKFPPSFPSCVWVPIKYMEESENDQGPGPVLAECPVKQTGNNVQ